MKNINLNSGETITNVYHIRFVGKQEVYVFFTSLSDEGEILTSERSILISDIEYIN